MEYRPYNYQKYATDKILSQNKVGLFLDMGLGKTVITLTAIYELIYNMFQVGKVLIIAPLRVAQTTWSDEKDKWDHLKRLRISKILGRPEERIKALNSEADIYIINRENVQWLCGVLGNHKFPFDMVVIDELSSFKSPKTNRFRALKFRMGMVKRVVGLTGTPAPNGLLDLWSQIYLLDNGERLGRTLSGYREDYFVPDKRNRNIIYSYKLKPLADKAILDKLSDLCISIQAKDYLELPPRIDRTVSIEMPKNIKNRYEEFEREQYMFIKDKEITALSAGALINKLLQFSNGAVYDENSEWQEVHSLKLDALEEIIDVSNGQSILCFYSYKHDAERILKKFPQAIKLEKEQDIRDWNAGKIPLLLCHPASAGHGLNLQAGGHIIVWFGLPWSLELYQQANARLYRQGQGEPVIIHHITCKDTVDERVYQALTSKANVQGEVIGFLKAKFK